MTVAVALLVGMVAQSLAYHLRLPGIVILLLCGVALGPDGLGLIDPSGLGSGLRVLIGFAIAVILFEGGMNLEWKQLRREAGIIQRLVTMGSGVTWVGAALCARAILGWDWRLSILFGSLVIVTGPTVVTPLLRRIRVRRNLQTILEAEGVFIDAIGAIIALVAFDAAFETSGASVATGVANVAARLAVGAVVGAVGGTVALILLRFRRLVPAGMEKVFTLTLAWATFQASNVIAPESGILAAVVAGVIATNVARETTRGVREFKEQLTIMLIGMLFVLLAADVRVAEVTSLGPRALVVVAALMLLVRPLEIVACTARSGLSWREKCFLSWVAPRGIVAASVATLFHEGMQARGIAGGESVRGLVFLVIIGTVLVQGLTGSLVAGWLGVKRPRGQGYVILGANPLAEEVARALQRGGEDSLLIDANPTLCNEVQGRGLRVLHGNALDERVMQRAEIETRKAVISLLPNDGVNLLFARRAVDEYRADRVYVAMHGGAIKPAHVSEIRGRVLFGSDVDVDVWMSRLARGEATVGSWRFTGVPDTKSNPTMPPPKDVRTLVLPMAVARGNVVRPVDDRYEPKKGDVVTWLTFARREDEARGWLRGRGWSEHTTA
jgi:NhaP-type Na+/H+ or K+/H+ antiporter